MIESLGFPIVGLIFLCVTSFFFFSKKKYKTLENDLFTILLLFTIFISAFGIICTLTMANHDKIPLLNEILCRIYVLGIIVWMSLILAYLWSLGRNSMYEKTSQILKERYIKSLFVFSSVTYIVSLFYGLTFTSEYNDSVYIIGGEGKFALYSFVVIMIVSISYILFIKKRNLPLTRRLPLFFFVFYLIFVSVLQLTIYDFNDLTYLYCLCVIAIYFSIENPDVQLIEKLKKTNLDAENAFKNKSDFLLEMSHQIRNPLNSIVGFSQSVINDKNISKNNLKKYIEYINYSSKELLNTVNNILDFSIIKSEIIELNEIPYLISDVVSNLKDYVKSRINENVKFKVSIDKKVPSVLIGDSDKIFKILKELLNNSMKFTQSGIIELKIGCEKRPDSVDLLLTINDTGIGIEKQKLDLIFNDMDDYSEIDGVLDNSTIISYLVVKKLVQILNGEIIFNSSFEDGTSYKVRISNLICEDDNKVKNVISKIEKIDCSKYNVMLVGNDDITLRANLMLLKELKFNITTCNNGSECIEKIKAGYNYDLIFVSYDLFGLSCIETLSKIKKVSNNKLNIIIGISSDIKHKNNYKNYGFTDFLSNPINRVDLLKIVNKYYYKDKEDNNNV